ncbi:hypothetical protein OG439_46270 [Amycolatopsis sp. NBC_01307]|uniref:hypothetical protein n=1 Tax=Amycolatopsis sp. NBC_01307 TaxID=2903561 RepID=UPI002E0EA036|nr:hypothetical protein OG439_46270 [Amycolatopsis sp. NBC_01307]
MELLAVEIDNWKSFDHTGRVNLDRINLLVGRITAASQHLFVLCTSSKMGYCQR